MVVTASHRRESLSLEQIEDSYWGDPPADATRLVATAHALRRRPIGTLDVEDLRLLLGQQEGVEVLTPLALTKLEGNPLAEGDFYPGDLFEAVLKNPRATGGRTRTSVPACDWSSRRSTRWETSRNTTRRTTPSGRRSTASCPRPSLAARGMGTPGSGSTY
ncbi:contact-dependent growth inhibition system immunity protein [Amycolatopsis sp. PS_44_ISF1]|nr:contact-dependent growth inhibition system immunity protein [Amycolatopsis sp. PS_44_ISF1]